MSEPVCLDDFETIARSRLPKQAYDYYRSGADDELTLRRNVEAFRRILIRPRVLIDVTNRNTLVELLDGTSRMAFPIGIASTATQKMAHPDGEAATAKGKQLCAGISIKWPFSIHQLQMYDEAGVSVIGVTVPANLLVPPPADQSVCEKAAASSGTIMIVSTIATTSLEEVAASAPNGHRWFQLYVYKDRAVTVDLVKRAERAGYKALVLTVDTPYGGKRRDDLRNGYSLPPHLKMANFPQDDTKATSAVSKGKGTSGFNEYVAKLLSASLTWKDVDWLRSITGLPIIVKGVLTGEDAAEACKHGVSGIIVSNHGARQLDSAPATIEALPEVVDAVQGQCDVFLDGGVRTGGDVFKALALGAKAVFIGRPILWGLAYDGEAGAAKVLEIIRDEFSLVMALAGCSAVQEIGPGKSLVVHEDYYKRLAKL